MNAKNCRLAAFFAVTICVLPPAQALDQEIDGAPLDYDQKIIPGAICSAGNPSSAYVAKGGAIYNTSYSASNEIVCPIIWDRASDVTDVEFNVSRPSGSGTMTCFVALKDAAGNITQITKTVEGTGSSVWVSFFHIPSFLKYSTSAGCTLPRQVNSYSRSAINWIVSYQY